MKKIFAAGAMMLATAGTAYAACDSGERVVRFSHVTANSGHPKGDAAALFAERINAEMDGRLCMEVFPNSQLYNDNKVLEALVLGDVELAAPSLSKFEQFTLSFRIFDLPFLFADVDAVDSFQASAAAQSMLDSMQDSGIQGLGFWHNGMKQMSANKALINPDDADGLTFRIMTSDVIQAYIQELGGNPQKMAFSEVYGALQTGVVDAQENTWSNIYTKKFFEVQDGITETNHGILDYLVVTSTEFLDSLSDADRADFMRIFEEVTTERNALSTSINLANRQKILDEGGVIRLLTAEERAAWVEKMKPVWATFADQIGQDLIDAALTHSE
jgi:C4-dicarboxylate-binding protein DctP